MGDISLFLIRITLAWMFAYPLHLFFNNFQGAKAAAGLINDRMSTFLAIIMMAIMLVGSILLLLGVFVKEVAILFFIYSCLGYYAHKKLANQSVKLKTSESSIHDIAISGQTSSAWKNIPICTLAVLLIINGPGKISI
jgi:uncharacterized membrane protein YphA (DoxX/SURF4 family)